MNFAKAAEIFKTVWGEHKTHLDVWGIKPRLPAGFTYGRIRRISATDTVAPGMDPSSSNITACSCLNAARDERLAGLVKPFFGGK